MTRGLWELVTLNLMKTEEDATSWAEARNSYNRAELGAACLPLEDAKRKQDRKPTILLLSLLPLLLPKMDRGG